MLTQQCDMLLTKREEDPMRTNSHTNNRSSSFFPLHRYREETLLSHGYPDWALNRQEEANTSKESYYLVDPGLKLRSNSCEEQIWSGEDREKGASQ